MDGSVRFIADTVDKSKLPCRVLAKQAMKIYPWINRQAAALRCADCPRLKHRVGVMNLRVENGALPLSAARGHVGDFGGVAVVDGGKRIAIYRHRWAADRRKQRQRASCW